MDNPPRSAGLLIAFRNLSHKSINPCRPRFPVGFAAHAMSGSNQIVSEPRLLSALLYAGQFRVL